MALVSSADLEIAQVMDQTEHFVLKMQVEDAVLNHLTPPAYTEVASGLQIQGIFWNVEQFL